MKIIMTAAFILHPSYFILSTRTEIHMRKSKLEDYH